MAMPAEDAQRIAEKNGGPAFPFIPKEGEYYFIGMSRRDFFAAHALQGILARHTQYGGTATTIGSATKSACDHADMMVEKLNPKEDNDGKSK